jgi:hypothetical protein
MASFAASRTPVMRVAALMKAALLAVVCGAGPAPGAHAQERGAWRSVGGAPTSSSASAHAAPRHAPASRGAPRSQFARLDTTTASPPGADPWWALDKAKHAGGSFLLVLGGQYVFEQKATLEQGPALALSLGTGAAVGLAKEIYDRRFGPTRYFSMRDLVADALGLLLGAGVVLL